MASYCPVGGGLVPSLGAVGAHVGDACAPRVNDEVRVEAAQGGEGREGEGRGGEGRGGEEPSREEMRRVQGPSPPHTLAKALLISRT